MYRNQFKLNWWSKPKALEENIRENNLDIGLGDMLHEYATKSTAKMWKELDAYQLMNG